MPINVLFSFVFLSFLLAQAAGCSRSSSGTLLKNSDPEGEEYEVIGVVNGLWKYDMNENLSRLNELMPDGSFTDVDEASKLYQVRAGLKRSMLTSSASEVVILPDGWSYTTESDIEGDNVINIGDVIAIRAQKHRQVDFFTRIVRKCNEAPTEDERPEWNIGCQSVSEFDETGYGGNTYFWTGF